MKVTKHGMGSYRTGHHPRGPGRPPQYQRQSLLEAAAVAPLRPSRSWPVRDGCQLHTGRRAATDAATGQLGGEDLGREDLVGRQESVLHWPVETRRSRPRGAPVASVGRKRIHIEKVVVSVRRVKGMHPALRSG